MWITSRECVSIPCCVDERLCGDTLLRCEKIKNDFIVSDILLYNSNRVFACSTFEQRYNWLKVLLKFITPIPNFPNFIHKSELQKHHKTRGVETYTDEIGSSGYYSDLDGALVKFKKLTLPDCYVCQDGSYLRVPCLRLSEYFRTLGSEFELRCKENGDGSWSVME